MRNMSNVSVKIAVRINLKYYFFCF